MRRREFIAARPAAVIAASAAPLLGAAETRPIPTFRKAAALRFPGYSFDLSEAAVEDALILLGRAASGPLARMHIPAVAWLLVPPQLVFTAARTLEAAQMVGGWAELRKNFACVPQIELAFEQSFTSADEWGIVTNDGLCFYCPGVV